MKQSTVYTLVMSLVLLIPLAGYATLETGQTAPDAAETQIESPVDVKTPDVKMPDNLLNPETLVPQTTTPGGRCNCNVATGLGFCAVGQTCQSCPCFTTQGSFFDGRCG